MKSKGKINILYRTYAYYENAVNSIINESLRLKRNIWGEILIHTVVYKQMIKTDNFSSKVKLRKVMGHRIYPYKKLE